MAKLSIYQIHNTVGDQFRQIEASSKSEALRIFRRLEGNQPALRAYKLRPDDIVSPQVIRKNPGILKPPKGKWIKAKAVKFNRNGTVSVKAVGRVKAKRANPAKTRTKRKARRR